VEKIKLSRSDKTVKAILGAAGIEYTGRKISAVVTETVNLFNLNWCEGTRTYYYAVDLRDLVGRGMACEAPWNEKREGACVLVPAGFVIVEHHFFGSSEWITIKVNPADAPRLLKAVPVAA
jgi:hypothetical protein